MEDAASALSNPDGNELLLFFIILLPLLGAVLIAALKSKKKLRNLAAVIISGIVFSLCALLFIKVVQGPVSLEWPLFAGIGLHLKADLFGALFALFASLIWFLATLFSCTYMAHERHRTRYYIFLAMTLTGCAGVFLTGDLFSLFLFFEMMSLTSYALVVHSETREAMSAGKNYLYLSIFGGLALLTGILLLFFYTGSIALDPQGEALSEVGAVRYLIILFLITGFGIKAGMVPLHIWLPKAHPVAPAPASALLSGIMIKTGAYGIIRVLAIFTPRGATAVPLPGGILDAWTFTQNIGLVIIYIAVITMLSAALMALFQSNIKRVLAYSSISQMGYILMGVGCAAYLGYEGAMGFGGFTYHILNHAFFKAGLFMMAGAIYYRSHELEFSRLGGLAGKAPFTASAFLIAALGISGFPGFNGYISKTLLHHAIVEAYQYQQLFSLQLAEFCFTITGALTVCYIFKLFTGIFTGPRPAHLDKMPGEPLLEKIIFGAIAAAILLPGLFPQVVLEKIMVPTANVFVYNSYGVEYLLKQDFLNPADLMGVLIPVALGLTLLYLMKKHELFSKIKFPVWLSIDRYLYEPASIYSLGTFTALGNVLEKNVDRLYLSAPETLSCIYRGVEGFETRFLLKTGQKLNDTVITARETLYQFWLNVIDTIFSSLGQFLRQGFRTLFQFDYKPGESKSFRTVNMTNLDFYLIIILLTLLIIMGLAFLLL